MGKVNLLLLLLAYIHYCSAQTNCNSIFNKMVFVSKDTIIDGTAYFYDDGYFAMKPTIDTIDHVISETMLFSGKTNTLQFKYNAQKVDTIKYIFDEYRCKDLSIMNQPTEHISNVLYKYSYIASIFGVTDPICQLRLIIPMQEVSFCSEYYDISAYFDDDSSIIVKYKHAISNNINGLMVDFCDSLKCDSKLYTMPIKRHYRKLISDKDIKTEIRADVNPYYLYMPHRSILISPYNYERRFNSKQLEKVQDALLRLVRGNDRQKKRISSE